MTDAQKYRMRLVRAHIDYITAEIKDIDSEIEKMISSNPDYENAVQLLCTIPASLYFLSLYPLFCLLIIHFNII